MVVLKTEAQVKSFLKRHGKSDYNSVTYDIGSAWVDALATAVEGDKVLQCTTVSKFWDDHETFTRIIAVIRHRKK